MWCVSCVATSLFLILDWVWHLSVRRWHLFLLWSELLSVIFTFCEKCRNNWTGNLYYLLFRWPSSSFPISSFYTLALQTPLLFAQCGAWCSSWKEAILTVVLFEQLANGLWRSVLMFSGQILNFWLSGRVEIETKQSSLCSISIVQASTLMPFECEPMLLGSSYNLWERVYL